MERKTSLMRKLVEQLTPLLLVLLIWTAVALSVQVLRGVSMPTPWQTAERLFTLLGGTPLAGHSLYFHLKASALRWLCGSFIATILGMSYGLLSGGVPKVAQATRGIPEVLLMIPGLAWIPVAILLFGIGEGSTIFMIAVAAFAPLAVNVRDGIQGVNPHLVRAARMMGANQCTLFFQVLLPAALPAFITGMRLSLGTGWRVLVAAEMVVGTGTGLGYSIIQARWSLDYTAAFVCIAIICLVGLTVERFLLQVVERKTINRWNLTQDAP